MPTSTAHRNRAACRHRSRPARPPIDDTRIREIMELAPPSHLLREFPASERAATTTYEARQAIHRVLHGADDRLLVVVGPVLDPRLRRGDRLRDAPVGANGASSPPTSSS